MTVQEDPISTPRGAGAMRATRFDSVTSFFMACMLLLGCVVSILFVVWLADDQDTDVEPKEPVFRAITASSSGIETDLTFDEPQRSETRDIVDVPIEEVVTSLSNVAAGVAVEMVDVDENSSPRRGDPNGDDDVNLIGEDGDHDVIPRFERWVLKFRAKTISDYAKQLDFFEIELGAIGGSIQGVDYVSQVSKDAKYRRVIDTGSEKRSYFMWQHKTALSQWDRQLLTRADVPLSDRQVLKFLSPKLEHVLASLELRHAMEKGHESVGQIAKTVFESRGDSEDYSFVVVSQRYRTE